MSIKNFIPEVWAANILENFHHEGVLTALADREYEGEAKIGNTVHIPGFVDVQVKDYKTGVIKDAQAQPIPRTTAPDRVQTTGIDLKIDQEKSFDFLVDDVDRVQSQYSFDAYTRSAATGLVEDAEAFLTTLICTEGTKVTGLTDPTDAASARGVLLKLRGALTKAKTPQASRYALINAPFEELLLSGDSKLVQADKSGSTDGLREAIIGRLMGFDVITSPFLDDSAPMAVAFHQPALAYVSQVNEQEALRDQDSFADRVRGLHVYGGKIVRPTAVQIYKKGA